MNLKNKALSKKLSGEKFSILNSDKIFFMFIITDSNNILIIGKDE